MNDRKIPLAAEGITPSRARRNKCPHCADGHEKKANPFAVGFSPVYHLINGYKIICWDQEIRPPTILPKKTAWRPSDG